MGFLSVHLEHAQEVKSGLDGDAGVKRTDSPRTSMTRAFRVWMVQKGMSSVQGVEGVNMRFECSGCGAFRVWSVHGVECSRCAWY